MTGPRQSAGPDGLRRADVPRASFQGGGAFFNDVRAEVEAYLVATQALPRARRQLRVKIALGFALLIGSWAYLVFAASAVVFVVAAAVGLLLGAIIVSVCVMHDVNHRAAFESKQWSHLLGWTVDSCLGFSSYAWRIKHNVHHSYPNVDGYDDDINHAPLARMAPSQRTRPWYRWQHLYIWLLYALALLRWHVTDLLMLRRGKVGASILPLPTGWDLSGLIIGKALFVSCAFGIPIVVAHQALWVVLSVYLGVTLTSSFVMAIVFQLAHCVEEAEFLSPSDLTETRIFWAVHEVESTANFCTQNRVITWLVGGLNCQIEHHLFPRLPHTLYPLIAPSVRRVAAKHGVRYTEHEALRIALRSHYRHVRSMGRLRLEVELEMG